LLLWRHCWNQSERANYSGKQKRNNRRATAQKRGYLGEHLGQLFTIIWTVSLSISFSKLKLVPGWIIWLGYISSFIYFLAQAELFETVIPEFPVWGMAGFIGSTLWLLWLILIGVTFLKVDLDSLVPVTS